MAPYSAEEERGKLWYLKYTNPELSKALTNGPPPGVHPMTFRTFEPVYLLFVKSLGGNPTGNLRFTIKPAPIPIHVHAAHYLVWNFGGFVQVEKTGSWPLVAKYLGLNYSSPAPTFATCHALANAFKTNGLAQFEAWYTLSIQAGKFAPVNGIEITHPFPNPDECDAFQDMVLIWCNPETVEPIDKSATSTALAEILMNTTTYPRSGNGTSDPWLQKFRDMSNTLHGMRLHVRQVQTILEMSLSTSQELRDQGIPEGTILFVRQYEDTIQELRTRSEAAVESLASTASALGPSDASGDATQASTSVT